MDGDGEKSKDIAFLESAEKATSTNKEKQLQQKFERFSGVAYRYDGEIDAPFSWTKYRFPESNNMVPLVPLDAIFASAREVANVDENGVLRVELLKIDTDSIDCDILDGLLIPAMRRSQAILKKMNEKTEKNEENNSTDNEDTNKNKESDMNRNLIDIRNIVFESNGCTWAHDILDALSNEFNYTIYRADVLEEITYSESGERGVERHHMPEHLAGLAVDRFEVRFQRHVWRFNDGLSNEEWRRAVQGTQWQYFVVKEEFESRFHRR